MDIFDITYSWVRVATAIQRCDKIEVAAATTNITAWGRCLGRSERIFATAYRIPRTCRTAAHAANNILIIY